MSLEDLSVDELLAAARNALPSHEMLNALVNNPETREQTLRLIKKQNPKLVIPEIDARDQVMDQFSGTSKRVEELENQIREREVRDRIRDQRNSLKTKYGFDDNDIAEIEKLMVDEEAPIPHYEAAARVYKASKQAAVPNSAALSPPVFEMPDQNVWSGGVGNRAALDKIAMKEAFNALEELRSGKVSLG